MAAAGRRMFSSAKRPPPAASLYLAMSGKVETDAFSAGQLVERAACGDVEEARGGEGEGVLFFLFPSLPPMIL